MAKLMWRLNALRAVRASRFTSTGQVSRNAHPRYSSQSGTTHTLLWSVAAITLTAVGTGAGYTYGQFKGSFTDIPFKASIKYADVPTMLKVSFCLNGSI